MSVTAWVITSLGLPLALNPANTEDRPSRAGGLACFWVCSHFCGSIKLLPELVRVAGVAAVRYLDCRDF